MVSAKNFLPPVIAAILLALMLPSCSTGGKVAVNNNHDNSLPTAITGIDKRLNGLTIPYLPNNADVSGYFAQPDVKGRHGSIILLHDSKGLTDRIRMLADNFAAEKYHVFAINLLSGKTTDQSHRAGSPGKGVFRLRKTLYSHINEAIAFMRSHPDSNGRVALIGWSEGATLAVNYALDVGNNDATAIFYAELPQGSETFYRLNHEIYGTFVSSKHDSATQSLEDIQYVQIASGSYSDIYSYEDVDHEFWLYVDNNPKRNSFAATDAWIRLKAYLARNIKR